MALAAQKCERRELARLDARLVEGIDAVEAAREDRGHLEEVEEGAERLGRDLGQLERHARALRGRERRLRPALLRDDQVAETLAVEEVGRGIAHGSGNE